jgi:hypothetical protein
MAVEKTTQSVTVTQSTDAFSNSCSEFIGSFSTLNDVGVTPGDNSSSIFSGLAVIDIRIWMLFVFIGLLGIVGNAIVALVLLRFTDMRRRLTNIYVINQSLVDCMVALCLFVTTIYQDDSIPPGFLGELKCRLWLVKVAILEFLSTFIFSNR